MASWMTKSRPSQPASPPRGSGVEPSAGIKAEVFRTEAHDVSEHADLLKPWDLDIGQVGAGAFRSTLDGLVTPRLLLYEERWSRRTYVRGSTPPGYMMIGANIGRRRSPPAWCGDDVDADRLGCAPPAGEVSLVSPNDSRHAILLVKPDVLVQALGRKWADYLCSRRSFRTDANVGARFGESIARNVRRYVNQPELLTRPFEIRMLESRLLALLSQCLGSANEDRSPGTPSTRGAAVHRAVEFAHGEDGRVTAYELSLAAGVSQRTLEYAFRERLGTTPGAYLRLVRLNGAHRELLASDPHTTRVWQVASAWGFRHQGRFSALHRRVFGELPSRTLQRSRPSSGRALLDVIPAGAGI